MSNRNITDEELRWVAISKLIATQPFLESLSQLESSFMFTSLDVSIIKKGGVVTRHYGYKPTIPIDAGCMEKNTTEASIKVITVELELLLDKLELVLKGYPDSKLRVDRDLVSNLSTTTVTIGTQCESWSTTL
jgi:hypothetical protein